MPAASPPTATSAQAGTPAAATTSIIPITANRRCTLRHGFWHQPCPPVPEGCLSLASDGHQQALVGLSIPGFIVRGERVARLALVAGCGRGWRQHRPIAAVPR